MRYFKVKCFTIGGVGVYHVIDTTTNVTASNHPTLELAMTAMRQLNALERSKAKALVSRGSIKSF